MIKNLFSYLSMFGGIALIYICIMLTIELSSYNHLKTASADLEFFQSTNRGEYNSDIWSSQEWPQQDVYRRVRIERTPVGPPGQVSIGRTDSFTPVPPSESSSDSH